MVEVMVVDASVARQCGNVTQVNDLSKSCREALRLIESGGIKVVISTSLRREWRQHASRYAWQWLTDMVSRDRAVAVAPERHAGLRASLATLSGENRREVEKDLLLTEAALEAGQRVLSRDDAQRRLLRSLVPEVPDLSPVHWVGPQHPQCLPWLEAGAPDDRVLQLQSKL